MNSLKVEKRFGLVPNSILNSKELSFRAKGIWAYIYSKPDGWEFSVKNIAYQSKEGIEAVRNAVKELETQHLLKRTKFQNELGHWDIEYLLLDVEVVKPYDGKPDAGKPYNGKSTNNSNKELSKKDIVKKKENTSENKFSQDITNIMELFSQINPSIQYGNKTQRKACKDMILKFGASNVIHMVEQVILVQGQKYAPTATTPYAMYTKLGDFKVYFDKSKTASKVLDLSK
jgi:hypothetical protein